MRPPDAGRLAPSISLLLAPRSLRPWKHYVPLPQGQRSAGVILSLVAQLRRDDDRARGIAETAQKWAYR
jgi:hypothetical protein